MLSKRRVRIAISLLVVVILPIVVQSIETRLGWPDWISYLVSFPTALLLGLWIAGGECTKYSTRRIVEVERHE